MPTAIQRHQILEAAKSVTALYESIGGPEDEWTPNLVDGNKRLEWIYEENEDDETSDLLGHLYYATSRLADYMSEAEVINF